jgi:hypothetical protein
MARPSASFRQSYANGPMPKPTRTQIAEPISCPFAASLQQTSTPLRDKIANAISRLTVTEDNLLTLHN